MFIVAFVQPPYCSTGSRRIADVAVKGGKIAALEEKLPESSDAREIDARGMLVLPGVIDVHTHTRVASDEEPDRFFQDSVAAAFGGTTTFLAFNNPGTGSPRTHSLHRRHPRLARGNRLRLGGRLRRQPGRYARRTGGAGRAAGGGGRRRAHVQGVHGLRLRRARRDAVQSCWHSRPNTTACSRFTAKTERRSSHGLRSCSRKARLSRATTPIPGLTSSRPLAPTRRSRWRKAAAAPMYAVHLSCAEALRWSARPRRQANLCSPKRARNTWRSTTRVTSCRHMRRPSSSSRRRCARTASVNSCGPALAAGGLALVATDHVPDRVAIEKQSYPRVVRQDQQWRPGHRDAAHDRLQRRRDQGPDQRRADGRPPVDDAGPAVRA